MSEKKEKILPPRKDIPCKETQPNLAKTHPEKKPRSYASRIVLEALPRECKFTYMTPGAYATGFRILDVYKTEVDYTEMRSLLFLEDPKQYKKWGLLKSRLPLPEGRVTDLPGTRDLHYKNYYLRSLTPESTSSWRKSITEPENYSEVINNEENEQLPEDDNSQEILKTENQFTPPTYNA